MAHIQYIKITPRRSQIFFLSILMTEAYMNYTARKAFVSKTALKHLYNNGQPVAVEVWVLSKSFCVGLFMEQKCNS